jgi:actin-related protein
MKKKEKIAEMMFEIFDVPGLLFSNQTVCSLYAYGRINGFVVDLSDSLTHLVPYVNGISLKDKEKWYNIGGKDLTNYMVKLLAKDARQDVKYFDAKVIREKACYIPFDYDLEYQKYQKYNCNDKNDGMTFGCRE